MLAERYRIVRTVDRGSYGLVYEAEDLVADLRVAIKQILPTSGLELRRTLREIAALRALRLPGIVPLLDDFQEGGLYYLVMTLAEGSPFPGRRAPVPWAELQAPTQALLAALGRVHAAGFVHRDIKPRNVLVAADGGVTVLDFGLARRPDRGEEVTAPGEVAGTPEYLAPEVLNGDTASPRSDLFSVGVMLYEALSGSLPWYGRNTVQLLQARMFADPVPVQQLVPLPGEVARVLMRLLHREAEHRPASAADVLRALDPARARVEKRLPRFGSLRVVEEAVVALRGGSVDVAIAAGHGRTRFCEDVAERIRAEGGSAVFLRPGARPFESLVPVVGALDPLAGLGLIEVWGWVRQRVRERLDAGLVVFADNPDALDPWSAQALGELREHGVLRVVAPGQRAELAVGPLSAADLRPLFAGPDRILHLQTDAAAELHVRTGGVPVRIMAELAAWVGAGLAMWKGDVLHVSRDAIFRLQAGQGRDLALRAVVVPTTPLADDMEQLSGFIGLVRPALALDDLVAATEWSPWEVEVLVERLEAAGAIVRLPDGRIRDNTGGSAASRWTSQRRAVVCGKLARAMKPGTEGRLLCLLVAGRLVDAAVEARVLATRQAESGRVGEALATLEQALRLGREELPASEERALLEDYVELALGTGSARVLRRVAWELGRAACEPRDLRALVAAALAALTGHGPEALTDAEAVPCFARPELEIWRASVRLQAAAQAGRGQEERVLEALAESGFCELPGAQARYAGWLGALRFHQGRWDEAALQYAESLRGGLRLDAQVQAMLQGAAALVEAERLDAAEARIREAAALAEPVRLVALEARAAVLGRVLAYRRGETLAPDPELLLAVVTLAEPELEGRLRMVEACFAWRRGEPGASEEARRAAECFAGVGLVLCECLARAFALGCGATAGPDEVAFLELAGSRAPAPLVGAQILALLPTATSWREVVTGMLRTVHVEDPARPREVLSITEVRQAVGSQG